MIKLKEHKHLGCYGLLIEDNKIFTVTKEEIINNNYELTFNKYKPDEDQKIEYDDPKEIFKNIVEYR